MVRPIVSLPSQGRGYGTCFELTFGRWGYRRRRQSQAVYAPARFLQACPKFDVIQSERASRDSESVDGRNELRRALRKRDRTLKSENRYRTFANLERDAARFPVALWRPEDAAEAPREVTIWCSNDYLGMGGHAKPLEAAIRAAERHGAGAGGTRNISGTHNPIVQLEAELADLHRKPAALVFTSGWISNLASISTIAALLPNCLILSDALNHNSMIEGVRRAGCEKRSGGTTMWRIWKSC